MVIKEDVKTDEDDLRGKNKEANSSSNGTF
jgi:hypothetical protein